MTVCIRNGNEAMVLASDLVKERRRAINRTMSPTFPRKSALTRMEMTKGNACSAISQVTGR